VLVNRYFVSAEWATSPLNTRDYAQLRQVSTLLAKYGRTYGFDWRMLAAVAYRESGLDHGARSGAGAVGLMQVLPRTAATRAVGIDDIDDIDELENNVHAGVKYLAHLRDTHFDDPAIPPADRMDFVLAAYNAGPTRIAAARRRAAQEGLDGNRWFRHVEKVARRRIGLEPVSYVGDINRFYIAFVLLEEAEQERVRLRAGPGV